MRNPLRYAILRMHELGTGRHIWARMQEYDRIQWYTREELLQLQKDRLHRLLVYCQKHVPYYQRTFREAGFSADEVLKDVKYLQKLPLLTKDLIRENTADMLTGEATRRSRLSRLSTSGSTGHPLVFMQDPDFRDSVTASVQHHMGWAGWQVGDLQALIWASGFKKSYKQRARAKLIDWVWNRFQLNALEMSEHTMMEFARQVQRRKPPILFGYATSLYRFAQFVEQNSIRGITFNGIFSSAEQLLPPVREYVESIFSCKVYDRYGSLELGGMACECEEHQGLHVSMNDVFVEILGKEGEQLPAGESGDIVVTNLNNLGMPFIRYVTGDAGGWREDEKCPCGRGAVKIQPVEGRIMGTFKTRDGRVFSTGFSGSVFRSLSNPSIQQFQIVQQRVDHVVVRLVERTPVSLAVEEEITAAFHKIFREPISVTFERLQEIPALPSGKHQYSISELQGEKS